MAATTTRGTKNPSTTKLSLFNLLLPSFLRTLDCGFRYLFVIGFDLGDPYYDTEIGMKEVKDWFETYVTRVMRANGILVRLRLVRVNNSLKKPGPVFIEMARAAYDMGSDYFYRVNDDTELVVKWPKAFTKTLLHLSAPYGVVGPECA
jgi:hypothetical protein